MTYAPYGSDDFQSWMEERLEDLAQAVEAELRDNLVALVLAGGYGRGLGAVTKCLGSEWPYNDLDLVLVVRKKRGLQGLAAISHRFEREMRVEVDFSRPLTLRELRVLPPWLLWHDLALGHRVLRGPQDLVKRFFSTRVFEAPPASEATRLLLNRGIGLIRAQQLQRAGGDPTDPDFVRRNFYKAALALGDAELIRSGWHGTPWWSRRTALRRLGFTPSLLSLYDTAQQFKLYPDPFPQPSESELEALLEHWRLVFEASCSGTLQEPELSTPFHWACNLLRNLRVGRLSWIHPREFLYSNLLPSLRAPELWSQVLKIWRMYH